MVRGSELLKQGKLDQAQRAFRAALELDPDNARVLALLGLAHFRAGEFADARGIYEQLVERAPTDASHRLNLGLVHLKLNDAARAIAALEASRALDPSQGRAVSYLGLAYARGGRYAEAYRAFLIAGQNELAIEIESNLALAERERIHHQLGRTPQGPAPVIPRTMSSTAAVAGPRTAAPVPTVSRTPTSTGIPPTPPATIPRTPTPTGMPRTSPPMPGPGARTPVPTAARRSSAEMAAQAPPQSAPGAPTPAGVSRTPTPTGVPRTKPPSAPPRRVSREFAAIAPVDAPVDASSGAARPEPARADAPRADAPRADDAAAVPHAPARITESTQFVLPHGDPAAPRQTLDGPSMISRAVASATPQAIPGPRTRAGGVPPRPLSELATDDLVRPDDGEDAFEIGANGALIIRVTDRVLSRLDGVHVTGGDLTYEPAMRRSRGHNTEQAFDYRGSQLHAVSGRGYLIAVPGNRTFSAVTLDDDILYLREDLVFAFQASLRWENGHVPGLRGRLPIVQFRGDGALAMRLDRPLVRVKLTAQGMVFVDAERLAGWIGRVIPRAVVPPAGGPLGAMCVECTGEGIVLVEPVDARPAVAQARSLEAPRAAEPPQAPAASPAPAASSNGPSNAPAAASGAASGVPPAQPEAVQPSPTTQPTAAEPSGPDQHDAL